MRDLLWCFLSVRGVLNRLEYVLAFVALICVGAVLTSLVHKAMIGPDGPTTMAATVDAFAFGVLVESALLFWPSIAIQAKRLKDIGYSPLYLVPAYILITIFMLFASGLGVVLSLLFHAFLLVKPGRSAAGTPRR